jgi:hypothetical protein
MRWEPPSKRSANDWSPVDPSDAYDFSTRSSGHRHSAATCIDQLDEKAPAIPAARMRNRHPLDVGRALG